MEIVFLNSQIKFSPTKIMKLVPNSYKLILKNFLKNCRKIIFENVPADIRWIQNMPASGARALAHFSGACLNVLQKRHHAN